MLIDSNSGPMWCFPGSTMPAFRQVGEKQLPNPVLCMAWSPKRDLIALANTAGEVSPLLCDVSRPLGVTGCVFSVAAAAPPGQFSACMEPAAQRIHWKGDHCSRLETRWQK